MPSCLLLWILRIPVSVGALYCALVRIFLIIQRLAQFDVYNFKANGLLHVSTFNFSGNPHDCGAAVSLSVYVRGRDVHAVYVGSVGSSVVWT